MRKTSLLFAITFLAINGCAIAPDMTKALKKATCTGRVIAIKGFAGKLSAKDFETNAGDKLPCEMELANYKAVN